jgi:RHS repeat-associated protein
VGLSLLRCRDRGSYATEKVLEQYGNTRVLAEPEGQGVVQKTAYYPYGLQIADLGGGSSTNDDLYNGKELTESHGLNCYHYGARYYDVAIARWTTMDPADEFHSPYVYVGGDPVNLVDPDGRQAAVANASWLFNYLEPITQNGRQVGNVEVMGTLWFDEATVENQLNSYPAKWKESSPRVSNYLSDLKQRPRSEWIPVLIAERIEMADGGRATGIASNGVIALDRQGFTEATFHQEVLHLAFGASEFEAYSGDLAAGVRPWSDVRDRLSDPKGSIWRGSESYADQLGSSVDGNVVVNEEQLRQRMTTIGNAIIGKDE